MLQQTQVATVIDYWHRWMARFPNPQALAAADEQEVLALWAGLGYYRRARSLLAGAKLVAENGLPESAAAWRSVSGVGRYTASAIGSISRDEPVELVDGNVARVMARLTGCEQTGRALEAEAWTWAERELCRERPGDWNQALMELGATVCTPKSPLCAECPLAQNCVAKRLGKQDELPVAEKKPEPVRLTHQVRVVSSGDGRFKVRQVPEGSWWAGMWEFPGEIGDLAPRSEEPIYRASYVVTNHRITLFAFEAEDAEGEFCTFEELERLPMPAPQRKLARALVSRLPF